MGRYIAPWDETDPPSKSIGCGYFGTTHNLCRMNELVRFAWWRAFTKTGDIRISPVFYGLWRAD